MQYSHTNRDELFIRKQFDGIIYACTEDAKIESIYSPHFGQIVVEKPIDNRIRLSEGRSCKFSAYCKDGAWYAKTITVLPSSPLPMEHKREHFIIKGIGVVCGVYEDIGWLWSDVLGRILINKQLIKDLKAFTCVQFRAVRCSHQEPSVGYQAENISVKKDAVFQSEILRFKKSVIIEENGIARVDEKRKVILIDDRRVEGRFIRGAELLPVGSEASLLYYEEYSASVNELVSLFLTQDVQLVEGINDGAFSTRRHCARVQQVYRANELQKSYGNGSPTSLIFRFTDEEHSEQPIATETSNDSEGTNTNEAMNDMKSDQEMGKADIIDERSSSEDMGRVREEAATVCEAVMKSLELSSEENQLASEEENPKSTATTPTNEELLHESAIGMAESQNLTSVDNENSAAEVNPSIESENIINEESILNTAENVVEKEEDSITTSQQLNSESSSGENRSRDDTEHNDDLDSELFDEEFLKQYREEIRRNKKHSEAFCVKSEASYSEEFASECEIDSECSDEKAKTTNEAMNVSTCEKDMEESSTGSRDVHEMERCNGQQLDAESSAETGETIAEEPQKIESELMNKEQDEDAMESSKWMNAKKKLDEQILEVDHMLLDMLDAYKGDEDIIFNEVESSASSTLCTQQSSNRSIALSDNNPSVTNQFEQLQSSTAPTEGALRTALREFLTELIICEDMAYHIVAAQRVIIEGSYLLAIVSDYLSGVLVSLDELSEFMDITRESTFHNSCYRKHLEYDVHTELGIVICELMCRYVPQFTEKTIANCVSLSTESPYSSILLRYLQPSKSEE